MDGKTAIMLLNKPIGRSTAKEEAISGPDFAYELYDNKGAGLDVTVKINSFGGDVKYGWDMVDSILETKAKTENIGFAYSMAGICLMVGSDRVAYPHSQAMIHAPHRTDGKTDPHLDMLKERFKAILKNHSRFTDGEIQEMIDSGKDYFFTADEMKAKGMIDRIETTGYGRASSAYSRDEQYAYYNSLIENENKPTMNVFNAIFGKKSEEESAEAAFTMKAENTQLKSEKTALEASNTALQKEIETLKDEKAKEDVKSKAVQLIADAEKAGKLNGVTAEFKQKWIENASIDYDKVKSLFDGLPSAKTHSIAAAMKVEKPGGGEMTYEWLAKNNPQELARIAESDPELFGRLSAEYNEKQKEQKTA